MLEHGTRSMYVYNRCRCDLCREVQRQYALEWRAKNKAKIAETNRSFAAANREAMGEKVKAHRAANPGLYAAYSRKWYQANRALIKQRAPMARRTPAALAAKRAGNFRRRGVPFDAEARAYADVLKNDPCSYCGASGGTLDHIDAVVNGGTSHWGNLTAACRSCNARKRSRRLLTFLAS